MKVISLDPGYDRLGIAVLEKINGKEIILYSECYTTNKKETISQRILSIGNHLEYLITLYKPDTAALEKVFMNTNQKTIIGVSEVCGALKYIFEKNSIPIYEFTPLQIKIAITGYGRAKKEDILYMINKIVSITDSRKKIDDEIDAIAVGITFYSYYKTNLHNHLNKIST